MALKNRIIVKLLIDEIGIGCKFKQFTRAHRVVGDPVSLCRTLSSQVLDEFHFCFLGTADPALVREMNRACMTASSVAGSIRTIEHATKLIRECGVDKIVTKDDEVGRYVADKFGCQAACYPVSYSGDAPFFDIPEWAGEAMLTSIDRDGMGCGVDLGALRFPYDRPVVIGGGIGRLSHVRDAFVAGANGVAISSLFAFTDNNPIKLRSWLVSEGANVRDA